MGKKERKEQKMDHSLFLDPESLSIVPTSHNVESVVGIFLKLDVHYNIGTMTRYFGER
ncbi:MAG: hypothetical protein ACI8RD_014429 [Bacillariaceae sp.]|jgi:hypothetical protein